LKKWGEGASLIRKEWKAKEEKSEGRKKEGVVVDMKSHRKSGDDEMAVDDDDDDEDGDEDDEEEEEEEKAEADDLEATPRMLPRKTMSVHSPQTSLTSHPDTYVANHNRSTANNDLTNLADSLNSLSLVPNSIRFGRGGKSGGFIPHRGNTRSGKSNRDEAAIMKVDVVPGGRGIGRGSGRGRVAQAAA